MIPDSWYRLPYPKKSVFSYRWLNAKPKEAPNGRNDKNIQDKSKGRRQDSV